MLQDVDTILGSLAQQYGALGIVAALLLGLLIKYNKKAETRITDLETKRDEQALSNIAAHKEMVEKYAELINQHTKVLADLTACLKAMKDTLERIERSSK